MLARIFGAFKAFIAQLHASLVFTQRPIGAVTFDTGSVLWQFALHFNMTMDSAHKTSPLKRGTHNTRQQVGISKKGKHLQDALCGFLSELTHGLDVGV